MCIRDSSWDDKDNQKHYKTEIVVNDLVLLSGRGEGGESGGYSRSSSSSSSSSYDQRQPAPPDDLVQSTEITDDDIPF